MIDQRALAAARQQTYLLGLLNAYNNNSKIINVVEVLIQNITKIYNYIEPSHLKGKLTIFSKLNDSNFQNPPNSTPIYNLDALSNYNGRSIAIEPSSNGPFLLWNNLDNSSIINSNEILAYVYENGSEQFYINSTRVDIPHNFQFHCQSIFSLHYPVLIENLRNYGSLKVRNTSCSILRGSWADEKRIFFVSSPECIMQTSLKEFLSSFAGMEVVREYNLGASKPVDIRVKWLDVNKDALIEVKWIGKSIKKNKNIITYTDFRANDGMKQLKEYLDLKRSDSPNIISKAILVVIDGRRRRTNKNTKMVNSNDGLHYQDCDIAIKEEYKYFKTQKNFEYPMRFFAEPVCD